jgi:hypothetical protein
MLRWLVIGLALLYLVVAAILITQNMTVCVPIWLVIEAGILLAAIFFERWRYRPKVDRHVGRWQPTGERFVDPTTGHKMEVFYNPDTGERDYRDLDAEKS